jgi:hypothetical protein
MRTVTADLRQLYYDTLQIWRDLHKFAATYLAHGEGWLAEEVKDQINDVVEAVQAAADHLAAAAGIQAYVSSREAQRNPADSATRQLVDAYRKLADVNYRVIVLIENAGAHVAPPVLQALTQVLELLADAFEGLAAPLEAAQVHTVARMLD